MMNIDAQISASNALMLEKMMTTPKEAFVPRPDGRAVDALRPVEITRRFTKYAEGSVLMCAGDTGERGIRRHVVRRTGAGLELR